MTTRLTMGGVAASVVALVIGLQATGQEQALYRRPNVIASLREAGQGLTVRQRETDGRVTFAVGAPGGGGILLATSPQASAETRAREFVRVYGAAFGLRDDSQLGAARATPVDRLGVQHVRFQQTHLGVPVVGGDFLVHLRGARAIGANGHVVTGLPETVAATVPAPAALQSAAEVVAKMRTGETPRFSAPTLQILDKSVIEASFVGARVAWFIEATSPSVRESIWIDAQTGTVLHHVSQMAYAKSRTIYTANNGTTLPGAQIRTEGGPVTSDADADRAYDYTGAAYDFFQATFGRDSFDGAGATIASTVHFSYPDAVNLQRNAAWNGSQLVFRDGFSRADDIVAHEFTHAVIERTIGGAARPGLNYWGQSGALSESFGDIFGEATDLANGAGTDSAPVRWQIGEDLPTLGAIRSLSDPNAFGQPAKMSDALYYSCSDFNSAGTQEAGGVHINSGVPNHAFALMVDGGTFNGRTVSGLGLTKAAKIEFRAMTTYLTSGSNFIDAYTALQVACADLVGTDGITVNDCTQVKLALDAVELSRPAPCGPAAVAAPALCPALTPPQTTVSLDGFETTPIAWTTPSSSATQWTRAYGWAKSGNYSAYGDDPGVVSDHKLAMSSPVVIPAGARLYFDQAFDFEHGWDKTTGAEYFYDGGVVEYTTNGGSTWVDAGSLIEAGEGYTGTIASGFSNPLAGRSGFVNSSYGYTGTRLNLSTLSGRTVSFRFRVGSDAFTSSLGWTVDNVQLYVCGAAAESTNLVTGGNFSSGVGSWLPYSPVGGGIQWDVTGGVFRFFRPGADQAVVFQHTYQAVAPGGAVEAAFDVGNSTNLRRRFSVLIHEGDFSDLSVCTFTMEPNSPLRTYRMRTHTTKAWSDLNISVYAADIGNGTGGYYLLDNVSVGPVTQTATNGSQTQCLDPTAPSGLGTTSSDLVTNGTFTGGLTPWVAYGQITAAVNAGVLEFFKLAGTPTGVVFQGTSVGAVNGQWMDLNVQVGNSSALRQRVTLLLYEGDFSDLRACTFFIPPGQALNPYAIRASAGKNWSNATVAIYPSTVGTSPTAEWLRVDNVTLRKTTTSGLGTECIEPGSALN